MISWDVIARIKKDRRNADLGPIGELLGKPLGWIMYWIYEVVNNYGFSIIIFTLLTKIILLPISYKQQLGTVRMQALNPKLSKLRKQYANNQQKLAEEQQKLYAEEGVNPMGSCLPLIISMIILYGVLDVVYRPLSHILRISSGTLEKAKDIIEASGLAKGDKSFTSRPELSILKYVKENPDLFSDMGSDFVDKVSNFKNTFLGVDLGVIPTIHPDTWSKAAVALVMIPIISGLVQLLFTIYSQYKSKKMNPDECVALGASIQGGKLAGDAGAGEILLLDVTPLSLSIETMGGIATRLIERNTTIPTKKSQIFSTAADNQTAVDINVVQGERQFARDNKSLGQFRLDGIPPARRGVPQIEVTFDIDANGIVNVSAKDLGTGKEQHITITAGSNMSDEDIDKAVKEAAEYEAQDKKRKEGIDAKNEADAMVSQTEQAMNEAGDKLDPNDKQEVQADLDALKATIAGIGEEVTDAQIEELKAGKEKLMNSAQKLFAKMYEQTQGAGAQGAGPDMGAQGTGNANDDVVDGEFTEV